MYVLLHNKIPCVTAFAFRSPLGNNMLLTAGHNVCDTDKVSRTNHIVKGIFSITRRVLKNPLGVVFISIPVYEVIVDKFSVEDEFTDWAILKLKDSAIILPDHIEMCPVDEIPTMLDEPKLKVYHCPVESFLSAPGLGCVEANCVDNVSARSIYYPDYNVIELITGLEKG